MLKKKKKLNSKQIDKFIIFASLHRQSCRSISFEFSYFIRLATKATCSLTGLFLFPKLFKNGRLRVTKICHPSSKRKAQRYRSICKFARRSVFWRRFTWNGFLLYAYKGGMGAIKVLYRCSIKRFGNLKNILSSGSRRHHSKNRIQGRRFGISIRPKSLLNLLPRTATLSGKSLSRYSQRPHAMEIS